MNLSKGLLWALPLGLLTSFASAAWARRAELIVLPTLDSTGTCPEKLIAYETPRPYSPGGYATDGMIQLAEIATDISILENDQFSVTWAGNLKPEYETCAATAGMSTVDGEAHSGPSYVRVQMENGVARVVLDMTGMRDANGFTSVIVFQGMKDGNPRWAWGGTD